MVQNFASDLFAMTDDVEINMGDVEWALKTLKSSFSGPSAPSAEQGQLWYDSNRALLRHRGATSNWRGVIAGSSAFKIWVYANDFEEGFTEDPTLADCVIGLKGGSQAYNVTGGDGTKRGVWAINDLTINTEGAHTHSMQSHIHTLNSQSTSSLTGNIGYRIAIYVGGKWYFGDVNENGGSSVSRKTQIELDTGGPSVASTGVGVAHTHTKSFAGTWRPQAAVGIMVYPAII